MQLVVTWARNSAAPNPRGLSIGSAVSLERGDSRFQAVHARITKMIVRIVHRRLSAHEDRDDVMQDIFLQVFVRLHTLRDPRCLEVWAARLALNMVNAHLRRRRRHKVRGGAHTGPSLLVEEDWDAKLLAARAITVIRKLPARDREIF